MKAVRPAKPKSTRSNEPVEDVVEKQLSDSLYSNKDTRLSQKNSVKQTSKAKCQDRIQLSSNLIVTPFESLVYLSISPYF